MLFISTIFMILGIFKEYKIIEKSILTFGVVSEIFYITYLYIFKEINIYRYIIYSVIFLTMLIINMKLNKEKVRRILFIIFLLIGAINIINILI